MIHLFETDHWSTQLLLRFINVLIYEVAQAVLEVFIDCGVQRPQKASAAPWN
jgi:hypothetical protein